MCASMSIVLRFDLRTDLTLLLLFVAASTNTTRFLASSLSDDLFLPCILRMGVFMCGMKVSPCFFSISGCSGPAIP